MPDTLLLKLSQWACMKPSGGRNKTKNIETCLLEPEWVEDDAIIENKAFNKLNKGEIYGSHETSSRCNTYMQTDKKLAVKHKQTVTCLHLLISKLGRLYIATY